MCGTLEAWIRQRADEGGEWVDDAGRARDLRSIRRKSTRGTRVNVGDLWSGVRDERIWGNGLPTLGTALREAPVGVPLDQLLSTADLRGTWSDHLARVALFVHSIRVGTDIPAMIVDCDGSLIDGHHRLVAYTIVGVPHVDAHQLA